MKSPYAYSCARPQALVGEKYTVISNEGYTRFCEIGDTITLAHNDKSTCPRFIKESGETFYMDWWLLAPFEESHSSPSLISAGIDGTIVNVKSKYKIKHGN